MANTVPHYTSDPTIFPLEGGCCCGLIRYTLQSTPIVVHCCHCTSCQREQGSAFAINVVIEHTSFVLKPPSAAKIPASIGGKPAVAARPAMAAPSALGLQASGSGSGGDSSAGASASASVYDPILIATPSESGVPHQLARCPRCFTAVYSEYAGTGPFLKYVVGGTLDEPWRVAPDVHIFTASKRPFVVLDGAAPAFDGFYDRQEVWRPDALERLARLKPEMAEWRGTVQRAFLEASAREQEQEQEAEG